MAITTRLPKGHKLHPKKTGDTVAMPAMSMKCTGMDSDGCDMEGDVDDASQPKPASKKMTPREYLLRKKA